MWRFWPCLFSWYYRSYRLSPYPHLSPIQISEWKGLSITVSMSSLILMKKKKEWCYFLVIFYVAFSGVPERHQFVKDIIWLCLLVLWAFRMYSDIIGFASARKFACVFSVCPICSSRIEQTEMHWFVSTW